MTPENAGYLTVARYRQAHEDFQVGDVVDMYPLLEVVEEFTAPRPESAFGLKPPPMEVGPHDLAREAGAALLAERDGLRDWARRGCDCRKKARSTPLAAGYAWRGRSWIVVRPQTFPASVIDDALRLRTSSKAWPMHVEPNGSPHVDLTTCRFCRRHWAVLVRADGFGFARLDTPTFGAPLAE